MSITSDFEKILDIKKDINTAIRNKGVNIALDAPFEDYPDKIDDISTEGEGVIESLPITPSTSQQIISVPTGVDGFSPINVSAVTYAIDDNIIPENIKSGVTILGVTGNCETLNGTSLTVTPANSAQQITPENSYNAFTSITVNPVTSAVDSNIVARNIKDGVTILGVTGTYDGSDGYTITRDSSTSTYQYPTSSFIFTLPNEATDLGDYALDYAFYNCSTITKIDLSSLLDISGYRGAFNAIGECQNITNIDLSGLISLSGSSALNQFATNCRKINNINLSNLISITNENGLASSFNTCTSLPSLNLSKLTTITGKNACQQMCYGCTNLESVDLSNVSIITNTWIFRHAFYKCTKLTTLSFPKLNSQSFGGYTNQFNDMLKNVTGCTVHFPSNLQSVIGSWADVTAGFGGTNTTILFDLPATT